MVSRTSEVDLRDYQLATYPRNLTLGVPPNSLKPVTSFTMSLDRLVKRSFRVLSNEVKFAKTVLSNLRWDLAFVYFSSLDNIQHCFWMFFDPEDPAYIPGNQYVSVISEFYRTYDDKVFGELVNGFLDSTTIIVVSDHGHGLRPPRILNLNVLLKEAGLLREKRLSGKGTEGVRELIRQQTQRAIGASRGVAKLGSILLKAFPETLRKFTSLAPIDASESDAAVSDPSGGLKAYSYGGIRLRPGLRGTRRERVLDLVFDILGSGSGESPVHGLIKWACRREEWFTGPYTELYPDILLELREGIGLGWETRGPLVTDATTHRVHSGNHRMNTAFLGMFGDPHETLNRVSTIADVSRLVLETLGVQLTSADSGAQSGDGL